MPRSFHLLPLRPALLPLSPESRAPACCAMPCRGGVEETFPPQPCGVMRWLPVLSAASALSHSPITTLLLTLRDGLYFFCGQAVFTGLNTLFCCRISTSSPCRPGEWPTRVLTADLLHPNSPAVEQPPHSCKNLLPVFHRSLKTRHFTLCLESSAGVL